MSNIYAINPIFRRGGETIHSPGADTYATEYECLGFFNDGTYIDFTQPSNVRLILGGHKVTFSANSSNTHIPVLDQPYANPYINIPGSIQSFKYAVMVLGEGQNITPTTIADVTTKLNNPDASNNIFKGDHRNPLYFRLFSSVYMSCFPFVYEVVETGGTIQSQKLTTYSAVAPNTQLSGYNHTGGERITLDVNNTYDWVLKYNGHGGIGTAISLSDWCTALNTKWTNYTDQLTGSNKMIGFLFFYRGYNGTTVTTRQLIKSFLDNCSTIDTTNDWTHERLT